MLANKVVAIIGAGPVGLTTCRLLQQAGVTVKVFEREHDPKARVWGGTLDLHPQTGQKAFKKAGLLEQYFKRGIPMGRNITDISGKVLMKVQPCTESPEINRAELRNMIMESLKDDSVIWDRKFSHLEVNKTDQKWIVHFDNNKPSEICDVVIGANGGMSKVRPYITDKDIVHTGTYIIQAELSPDACPEFVSLCNDNIYMTAEDGVLFVANPQNNGALAYSAVFKTPEEWRDGRAGFDFKDNKSVANFLSDKFAGWGSIYSRLFDATTYFVGLPARILHLDTEWKTERPLPVTLVGDAAHLMPPFAGQGVNTGLIDAMVLSENLTSGKFDNISQAIADYEQQMFKYARDAQLETLVNEKKLHEREFSFAKRFQNQTS